MAKKSELKNTAAITGGLVSIEDGVKNREEYAPARKVRVELSFAVPDGGDPELFLDGVSNLAQSKLAELLGRKAPAPVIPEAPKTAPVTPQASKEPVRELTDKEKLAKDAGVLDDAPAPVATKPTPAPKDADELNDLLGDTAPPVPTDAELAKAAQQKNQDGKQRDGDKWAPAVIRDLVAEFAGAGKQIRDIPADKRADFLTKLKAL